MAPAQKRSDDSLAAAAATITTGKQTFCQYVDNIELMTTLFHEETRGTIRGGGPLL
jgi:hypothetical protein